MDPQARTAALPPPAPRIGLLTLALLVALLCSFLLQLPTWRVADWGQFAFYDPGTVLKGDALLAKGYVPTVDFGYTHGLLSLLYGRVGFAILGRSPAAFLALTLLAEAGIAWGLARILTATRLPRPALILFFLGLPIAIMPAYLTLTHPLEAMLLILAIAEQVEGRKDRALAIVTACVFVKPSMGYVYGALLVAFILVDALRQRRPLLFLRQLLPAAAVAILLTILLTLWQGVGPVIHTLLPTTGAKTYSATGFGFFTPSGRAFWWPPHWWEFLGTPAAIYLVAATVSAAGALWAVRQLWTARDATAQARCQLLLVAGALNSAFLLGFYGWTGSWSYYSYLPILGLTAATTLVPLQRRDLTRLLIALGLLLLIAQGESIGDALSCWRDKIRSPQTAGLWAYPAQVDEWTATLDAAHNEPTLIMTNGWIRNLPPNCQLPDAWFPEPGIPTASEIARVKAQAKHARCIILWWEYRSFDLWNSPDFQPLHNQFEPVLTGHWFTLLRRRD